MFLCIGISCRAGVSIEAVKLLISRPTFQVVAYLLSMLNFI